MWNDFKKFAFKGNLIDLAVAVVLGVALNNVVQAVVRDLVTPLIAAAGGEPDFAQLSFTINGSIFRYGDALNFIINFVVVAFVLFLMVKAIARLQKKEQAKEKPSVKTCVYCRESVAAEATRCRFCTSELAPV